MSFSLVPAGVEKPHAILEDEAEPADGLKIRNKYATPQDRNDPHNASKDPDLIGAREHEFLLWVSYSSGILGVATCHLPEHFPNFA